MAELTCPDCNTNLIYMEKSSSVSFSGILSIFMYLIGFIGLFFSGIFGVVTLILAFIVGTARGKNKVMMCPFCNKDVIRL